ncbi:phosphotransferase family protein [Sinobaca sp. H24]|uniref:phosphotransferase family protein n=1 Tax=Sinobaca sp. H24 TaxID=2923376 RepID=UPI0020799FDF|nr:phosphotransferase [Sinobaca sp. H24]
MNHNNWIVNSRGDLYLIDWDSASVRDPAYDIGLLLHEYIPEKEWTAWLDHYGLSLTETLKTKMNWYVVSHALQQALEHQRKNDLLTASQWITYLQTASFKTTAEKSGNNNDTYASLALREAYFPESYIRRNYNETRCDLFRRSFN